MYKKITDLDERELKGITFDFINIEEINLWLFNTQMQTYEKNPYNKLNQKHILEFCEYYNGKLLKTETLVHNIWGKLLLHFSEEDLLRLLNYGKTFYIGLYGCLEGILIYKDFLRSHFIGKNNVLKGKKDLIGFLEMELRSLFNNYPKNHEWEIGFLIDELYGYHGIGELDNEGEKDRYDYWRKFKEKGIVKIKIV